MLLVIITGVALWAGKKRPYLLVGWLWFLGVLVPVIGLVQVGSQARADRFCYVPEIGIFLAVTWFVKERWPQGGHALRAIAATVLLIFASLTAKQVTYWQDGATLFEHTIAVTKNNACAYANAGLNRAHAGDPVKAIEHYQALLRIQPDPVNDLAGVWTRTGETWKAAGGTESVSHGLAIPADRYRVALRTRGNAAKRPAK